MHVVFSLYGIKEKVDIMLNEMQSQKFLMPVTSPDKKETKQIWVQGSLRLVPGGLYEYIFPRENLDTVLTTLDFHSPIRPYNIDKKVMGISPLNMLKDFLKIEDAPKEFNTKEALLWRKEGITIIPLGIRKDKDMIEENNIEFKGWTHEAL